MRLLVALSVITRLRPLARTVPLRWTRRILIGCGSIGTSAGGLVIMISSSLVEHVVRYGLGRPAPYSKADRKARGIPDFDWQYLRHWSCSYQAEQGTPVEVLHKRLGHRDIRTTVQSYMHI